MKNLYFLSTALFLLACSSNQEQQPAEKASQVNLPTISLTSESFRPNGENDADWKINILANDSIILLASRLGYFNEEFCNDVQLYGRIIQSREFDFEVIPTVAFYATGCSKPFGDFLNNDSVPLYIDQKLLHHFLGSKIRIQSKAGIETEMTIQSDLTIFRSVLANGDLDTSDYRLTITPSTSFRFHPFILKTGDRCAASIKRDQSRYRYFLNKTGKTYNLIIDKRGYYQETDCEDCFQTIPLNE